MRYPPAHELSRAADVWALTLDVRALPPDVRTLPLDVRALVRSAEFGDWLSELHHYTTMVYHGVSMALNLKNAEVERLAAEVARLTGESKTEAIRKALEERHRRLKAVGPSIRRTRLLRLLRERIWPSIPKKQLGRRLTQAEEDAILGYGKDGV